MPMLGVGVRNAVWSGKMLTVALMACNELVVFGENEHEKKRIASRKSKN
jgi:hypothetical protein